MRTSLQLGGVQSNSVTNAKCPQLSLKAVWAPDTLQSDQPRPQTEDKAPKMELKLSRTGKRDEKKEKKGTEPVSHSAKIRRQSYEVRKTFLITPSKSSKNKSNNNNKKNKTKVIRSNSIKVIHFKKLL